MKIGGMLIIAVILCAPAVAALDDHTYIEVLGTGSIDWTAGVFQSKGVGFSPEMQDEVIQRTEFAPL